MSNDERPTIVSKKTFIRLRDLIIPFFKSDVKWQALGLLGLMIAFSLTIAGLNVLLSYKARDFMNSLSLREENDFYKRLLIYLGCFAVSTPITVFYSYTEQRFALLWRSWLTREFLKIYFHKLAFYRVSWQEGIDNPDQRLEEDIRSFSQITVSFFLILWNAFLTLFLFFNILGSISANLVFGVLIYSFIGSIITFVIGRSLIGLNFTQLKREADFRYKLVNIRDNSESIAFYRGEKKEFSRARQRLKLALENFKKIVKLNRNLNFFVSFYNNLKPVIPVVLVAPLLLKGEIEFGVIYQAQDAFVRVVEALSVMIQHFGTISTVGAIVSRLGSFKEGLKNSSEPKSNSGRMIKYVEADSVVFKDVTILTPVEETPLAKNLSFELKSGGLLITGTSGTGKTSILRTLAGLWVYGDGTITTPNKDDCVFLPQRPYIVLGTLRNQLLYAVKNTARTDKELKEALTRVGLGATLERVRGLDTIADWRTLLSIGEQQQLAFARVLLIKPKYLFLDEATTAVDSKAESALYGIVNEVTKLHISVGYRAALSKYHGMVLFLNSDGTWKLKEEVLCELND